MKKILIGIFALIMGVAIVVTVFLIKKNSSSVGTTVIQPVALCYQYSKPASRGYADRAFLELNIMGDGVTGEYRNLPAEKDSKVGTFVGTVSPMDPNISARTANVWWNSTAEGMNVTEQLNIQFGEGSAVALFGEMTDRGDGTYVYKDLTHLTPGFQMSQIDCDQLQEAKTVERYIRDNIKNIVSEKPVVGGSWYATTVYVNSATKTGMMNYEDGHIQGVAPFVYSVDGTKITITPITNGQKCYVYHHAATSDAPYTVDETINLTINGTDITGTKKGTQKGPDMTNGYAGALKGSLDQNMITLLFSYTIEGSQNREQEVYKIVPDGLEKLRYPLVDKGSVLTPDTTQAFQILFYAKTDCSTGR